MVGADRRTFQRLNVGGEYGYLRGIFILGQNEFDFDARELEVTAYGVNLSETQLGLVNGPDSEGKEYGGGSPGDCDSRSLMHSIHPENRNHLKHSFQLNRVLLRIVRYTSIDFLML